MPSSPGSETGAEHAAASEASAETGSDSDQLVAEVARIEDRYKRALADLDNYRKRSEREVERRVEEVSEALLRDWLVAVDSVERALRMEPDGTCADGLRAVLDQMDAVLRRQGTERFGAPGDKFDPERHEAVAVQAQAGVADRTIVAVERSGYSRGERVIRPAQVVVARAEQPAH